MLNPCYIFSCVLPQTWKIFITLCSEGLAKGYSHVGPGMICIQHHEQLHMSSAMCYNRHRSENEMTLGLSQGA